MKLKLPLLIQTPQDVAVCHSELLQYQKTQQTQQLSKQVGASQTAQLVALSPASQQLLDLNKTDDWSEIIATLADLPNQAPVVHLTVATKLTETGQTKLVKWFRETCHPAVLLSLMVVPEVAGGVIVRTPNRLHDYSYATSLEAHKTDLLKALTNV